jgi:hypothetical protein
MEIILVLIAPVIAAVTAVVCAFISARLNRRQAWEQSRREERRTAYVQVFERFARWAEDSADSSRWALLSAVYAARLVVCDNEPVYPALTELHRLLLEPSLDRARVGKALKSFWTLAHEELQN